MGIFFFFTMYILKLFIFFFSKKFFFYSFRHYHHLFLFFFFPLSPSCYFSTSLLIPLSPFVLLRSLPLVDWYLFHSGFQPNPSFYRPSAHHPTTRNHTQLWPACHPLSLTKHNRHALDALSPPIDIQITLISNIVDNKGGIWHIAHLVTF
jgi:hypothetical protein